MDIKAPLLKVSLAYFAGLLTYSYLLPPFKILLITSTPVFLAVIYLYLFNNSSTFLRVVTLLSLSLLAQLNLALHGYDDIINKATAIPAGRDDCAIIIADEVIKIDHKENRVNIVGTNLKYNERVSLRLSGVDNQPEKGDTIKGRCYTYPIDYLKVKKIYSIGYMYNGTFTILKRADSNRYNLLESIKWKYINKIEKLIPNKDRSSIIVALTTGYKGEMSDDKKMAFSKSGSMHLMAVSGLHVSFIYKILSFILIWMGNISFLKVLRSVIILLIIWIYALFTDMQPPILRAAIMISCNEVASITYRETNSLNSLAFSFLAITIINPLLFYEGGLRLSFMATLSIIVIKPFLTKKRYFKERFCNYLWNNLSLSISCQVGTLPLTLKYFGFIPTYFMFTNIVAIPLSALIIIFTIIQLVTAHTIISPIVAQILNILSETLITTVSRIESLPFSTIDIK